MRPMIFSTEDSRYFAENLAGHLGIDQKSEVDRRTFKGGESYYRIGVDNREDLFGQNAIFVASTHADKDFLDLNRVGSALAGYGTNRRIFVIPFFGYSTMERAVNPGEVVTAKPSCRTLSSIPNVCLGNVFLMADLHSSSMVHFFEGDCLRYELYLESVLTDAIRDLNLSNFMFGSADLGRPKWVKTFAKKFGNKIALIDKDRDFETTYVNQVIGDVDGKNVVIYDDMTRSADTIINAAHAFLQQGAKEIYAVLSHLALNDVEVIERLLHSPIKKIISTNTHPMSQHSLVLNCPNRFIIKDVSGVFASTISRLLGL